MTGQIRTLQDVVDWGLCTGCGAYYYACPGDQVDAKLAAFSVPTSDNNRHGRTV
jgi:hypothetical protein